MIRGAEEPPLRFCGGATKFGLTEVAVPLFIKLQVAQVDEEPSLLAACEYPDVIKRIQRRGINTNFGVKFLFVSSKEPVSLSGACCSLSRLIITTGDGGLDPLFFP